VQLSPRGRATGALLLAAAALLAGCGTPEPAASTVVGGREAAAETSGPPPDVLLVTIDTLRFDALGFAGSTRVKTPHLDALAAEGVVFERCHASNVVTLPSHTNILTGLYPYQHGVRENLGFRLDTKIPTLATLLKERGYVTGAFVGAFPLDSRFGLDRGFDVYDDRYPAGSSPYDFEMRERPAEQVVAAALDWFGKSAGKPRFVWVHVYDPHAPYRPPPPYDAQYRKDPYLGEVAFTDEALAPLFAAFEESGRGRAVAAVTSDHGEALGDHGELTHGLFTYESTLRVPLVVWAPGRLPAGRRTDSARHVDIAPTLLALAGVPAPADLSGRSLLETLPSRPNYFEALSANLNRGWAPLTGMLDGAHKFIDLPVPELYDLEKDPAEKTNLFATGRETAARLKRAIPADAPRAAARAADSEEAKRLLALGYLSGFAPQKERYEPADDPKSLVSLDTKIHNVVELYQHGKAAEATKLAREIVAERPQMPVGWEFLAFILQNIGRDAEAAAALRDAIRRQVATESMRVRLALLLSGHGQPQEALKLLTPLAASPERETQQARGIALADAGRSEEALAVFDAILREDPSDAEAWQNRGIAQLKKGDVAGALVSFDKGLAVNASLPRALNARGVALAQSGDPAGAISSWQRAAELDPRQYDALFNTGLVAAKMGRFDVARSALTRFVETAPASAYGKDIAAARQMLSRMPR
jgi:arylsulfatase A-like enzyme/Flp pilus assembly protein TadD